MMFTATKWDTVEQKQKFFEHFKRFVLSDFKSTLFPKWFYQRLSMTFGHIAHFDRGGFYATFFETTVGKIHFLQQAAGWQCFGDPKFTYSDVELALKLWVLGEGLVQKYIALQETAIEAAERAELARLQAKYGPPGLVTEVK